MRALLLSNFLACYFMQGGSAVQSCSLRCKGDLSFMN